MDRSASVEPGFRMLDALGKIAAAGELLEPGSDRRMAAAARRVAEIVGGRLVEVGLGGNRDQRLSGLTRRNGAPSAAVFDPRARSDEPAMEHSARRREHHA